MKDLRLRGPSTRFMNIILRQFVPSGPVLPGPLTPDPPIHMSAELMRSLSHTDRALGRVDGVAGILPSP